mmetsp:Transcript_22584/g.25707  ORF Transcript_22584/g.25707 Transcript_22584/m.25707 type:complete len:332 (-) Transcript_22584:212-1207(-)
MKTTTTTILSALVLCSSWILSSTWAFTSPTSKSSSIKQRQQQDTRKITELYAAGVDRRDLLCTPLVASSLLLLTRPNSANADAAANQDSVNIDNFLRTGVDGGGNMGVSSQAGKSRPQTGVVFRDGTEVIQEKRSGLVSAELLTGTKINPHAVLISFLSPLKLETGSVFDVECRDAKTGDGTFIAVTRDVEGKSLEELPSSFLIERLFDPTGRFSFYGPPTDVKVKSSKMVDGSMDESTGRVGGKRRVLEVNFSYLSQSTNAEIPRKALLVATLPEGTDNAILLVSSTKSTRWKNVQDNIRITTDSFRAIPSPKSKLKLRAKDRSNGSALF